MPETLVWYVLEVSLLEVNRSDFWSGDCGPVEADVAEGGSWGRLVCEGLRELEVEDCRWVDSPSVTEDAFSLAVEHGELRCGRGDGDQGNRVVECSLCSCARAHARLVAAGDEDHPGLDACSGLVVIGLNKLIVVGEGQCLDVERCDLGGCGGDWIGNFGERGRLGCLLDDRCYRLAGLGPPAFDLVEDGDLLCGSKRGERED